MGRKLDESIIEKNESIEVISVSSDQDEIYKKQVDLKNREFKKEMGLLN